MNLHIRTFGAAGAETVVILHGLFGSGDNWRTHAQALADRYRVVVPDMPNHGESDHTPAISYSDMADQVVGALTAEGISAAHVLGHSMGGKAAMAIALRHGSFVRSLVVADIAPKPYPHGHSSIFQAMRAVEAAAADGRVTRRRDADAIMERFIHVDSIRAFLLKNLVRSTSDGHAAWYWRLNLDDLVANYARIADWPVSAGRYDGAVLVIRGGRSDYVRDSDVDLFRRFFPSARLTTMADCGHWLHVENREEFLSLVSRFLP